MSALRALAADMTDPSNRAQATGALERFSVLLWDQGRRGSDYRKVGSQRYTIQQRLEGRAALRRWATVWEEWALRIDPAAGSVPA